MSLDIWRIDLADAKLLAPRVLNAKILCNHERQHASRLLNATQKSEYIVGRGAIKAILRIQYNTDQFGKSFIKTIRGKISPINDRLNICYSRTLSYCILAIYSKGEVGVDCENLGVRSTELHSLPLIDPIVDYLNKNNILSLPKTAQRLQAWTILEALIKLHGCTLLDIAENDRVDWLNVRLSEDSPVLFNSQTHENQLVFTWAIHKSVAPMSHAPTINTYAIDELELFC